MTALRAAIAWVWAGLWLRAQLARARVGRRLTPGPVATGPDFHLSAAEIPVEGVDFEPRELPAELVARLESTRGDIVDHARRSSVRRRRRARVRRRRTVSLAAAALLTLALLGASATALISGTTGIPAVDRLLGIVTQDGRPERGGTDIRPSGDTSRTRFEVPLGASGSADAVAYVSRTGELCLTVAFPKVAGRERVSNVGCNPVAMVRRQVLDSGISVVGITFGRPTVIGGYVSGEVESIDIRGREGTSSAAVTDIWDPGAPGVAPLRAFAGSHSGDPDSSDPTAYAIVLRFRNGRIETIQPFGGNP